MPLLVMGQKAAATAQFATGDVDYHIGIGHITQVG